jgi:glycosyl hydrolase family 26
MATVLSLSAAGALTALGAQTGVASASVARLSSNPVVAPLATVPPDATALSALRAAMSGSSSKLFGISPDGNSKGIVTVPALAADLHEPVDVVNIFVGWTQPLPTTSMRQIAQQGSVPELTLEPWNYTQGVNQPNVADSVIAGGAYDAYLRQFAAAAKAFGSPFLLRYAHEMNGNWYPWAASTNGNTAATYVQAWRHVHDIFTQAGATNVRWVWCPNAGGPTPVASVFPGAGYVDIVGLDGYNFGTTSSTWRTPSQIFSGLLRTVTALAPRTPVLINETGSGELGGSKATWLTQLFSYVQGQPALIGIVYSNFNSRWSLASSSTAMAAARQGLQPY